MGKNKDILLRTGQTLRPLPKDSKFFLHRNTLLYGMSNSGKSTIINEIMYLCREYISSVFIIFGSDLGGNTGYHGKVPSQCIISKNKIAPEWFEQLLKVQDGRMIFYNIANDIENLKSVFDKINYADANHVEQNILQKAHIIINEIERSKKEDSEKNSEIGRIKEISNKTVKKLYKETIRKFRTVLMSNESRLTQEEICCIKFLDFKPDLFIVLDDCADVLKKWTQKTTAFKEIFYQGRHRRITSIISTQDDKEIDVELRRSSAVNIFTTQQAASLNFDRAANGYYKDIKRQANACIEAIFFSDKDEKNYKKLVYVQNTTCPFYYTVASLYGDFKVGCKALWDLENKINEKKKNDNAGSSAFFNKYIN